MAFTKIAAAGIGSTGTVTLENVVVTGSVNTPSITGAASTENIITNSLVVSGVSTLGNTVVGGGTTQLIVTGDARITGILTIGTSSITLDGNVNQVNVGSGVTIHHTNGVQVGSNTLHSSGLTANTLNVGAGGTIITATGIGSVGVGITNPSHRLHVYGNSNTDFGQMGLIGVSNPPSSPTLSTLDDKATSNYESFQLTSLFAGDVHLRSYWGVSVDINDGELGDDGSASQSRITGTSSFTVNKRSSSTAFQNLFAIRNSGIIQTPNNIGGGLDIGYKKLASITGNYSANVWYNTGIDRTTDTGIYLLNAWVDTYLAGGQSYQMTYIGWFVMPNRSTNSSAVSNITLHSAGHAPNAEAIQFRTLLTPAATDSKIYLQWLSNFNLSNLDNTSGRTFQVAIHRFASALNSA